MQCQVGLNAQNFGSDYKMNLLQKSIITFYYANRVMHLYQSIFDNNLYISSILFELFSHKFLFVIDVNKI